MLRVTLYLPNAMVFLHFLEQRAYGIIPVFMEMKSFWH